MHTIKLSLQSFTNTKGTLFNGGYCDSYYYKYDTVCDTLFKICVYNTYKLLFKYIYIYIYI